MSETDMQVHRVATREISRYLRTQGFVTKKALFWGHDLLACGKRVVVPLYRSHASYNRAHQRWEQGIDCALVDDMLEYQFANMNEIVYVAIYERVGPEKHEPPLEGEWPCIRYCRLDRLGAGRRLPQAPNLGFYPVKKFGVVNA